MSNTSDANANSPSKWNIAAALAAWLLPGLGHFLLGQRRRGIILFFSISLMWTGGLLLGGISVIDRANHPAWFIAQMFLSPSVAVNYYHNRLRLTNAGVPKPKINSDDPTPAYVPSFGEIHAQGTLFTALAGMLNILAMMDVIYRDPNKKRLRENDADISGEEVNISNPATNP